MKNKNQQNTLSLFNKKPNDIVCSSITGAETNSQYIEGERKPLMDKRSRFNDEKINFMHNV